MIRVILVDDEMDALKNLKWELERFCLDVDVLKSCTDPAEAVLAINSLKPDCLFLDIEMPGMDGFGLLEKLEFKDFELIFTTAYDQYALQAFKSYAFAYLLKPIDTDELVACMERVRKNQESETLGAELRKVLGSIRPRAGRKVALNLAGKTLFVSVDSILYAKADGNYTEVYMRDERTVVLSRKLKEFEELLSDGPFFRVHKSYLVNTEAIRAFIFTDGHQVLLENEVSLPVSRGRKDQLLQLLGA